MFSIYYFASDKCFFYPNKCELSILAEVWEFHIGGYQVCEKWLKDRCGRELSAENIVHYGKVVSALGETIRIMREVDGVIESAGGWAVK